MVIKPRQIKVPRVESIAILNNFVSCKNVNMISKTYERQHVNIILNSFSFERLAYLTFYSFPTQNVNFCLEVACFIVSATHVFRELCS